MKEKLKKLKTVKYLSCGSDDTEGYQIFTPKFIVDEMIKTVGTETIIDFKKTILEPASGDGAFTCRILLERLKHVSKDKPGLDSLNALATIYSIEMDQSLINAQRNNIYTIMLDFAKKYNITSKQYIIALEDVILSNFFWAETNTVEGTLFGVFGHQLAYKMPLGIKGGEIITFYSFKFNDDYTYSKVIEGLE